MTKIPFIWQHDDASLDTLKEGLSCVSSEGCQSVMVFACNTNLYDNDQLNDILRDCDIPLFGGLFPSLVSDTRLIKTGVMLIGFYTSLLIQNYNELSDKKNISQCIEMSSSKFSGYSNFIIIADAFCSATESFIEGFYEYIGSGINVVGGCAGKSDFLSGPCIFTNDGLVSDTLQLIAFGDTINQAVGHGWDILGGPFLVTDSSGHNIKTLDYKPAFDLYQSSIYDFCGKKIMDENFGSIACDYPLGIAGLSTEIIVREPMRAVDGQLVCVGNIPTNSMIYILTGDQKNIVNAAAKAAEQVKSTNSTLFLLFDCITRELNMGSSFSDELLAIKQVVGKPPVVGAMSIGEISNTRSGAIQLYNKSIVIGGL